VASARPRYAQGSGVKFEHLSLEQGLSQVTVYCVLQDDQGFMWFGTQDGLNKYDGYSFTVYKPIPGVNNSLTHNFVRAVYQDREGMLWIGTNGGGLDRLDRDKELFTHFRNDPTDPHSLSNDTVQAIYQDREGVLWIGTFGGGLNKFDPDTEQFTRYQHNNFPYSLGNSNVWAIYEDREGVLWIGTDNGLDKFERDQEQFVHYRNDARDQYSLSSNSVRAIYQDHEGALWVGTTGGLNKFDRARDRFTRHRYDGTRSHNLMDYAVHSIYQDQEGLLWIGTETGLDSFDRAKRQCTHYQNDPGNPHSLSNDYVWSIYQDREGILWFGTYGGGVNKLDRSIERFAHYQTDVRDSYSLNDDSIWSIYQDREGVLWLGTAGGGLHRFDRDRERFTSYQNVFWDLNSLAHNSVRAIYEDHEGTLWMGTDNGLDRFERQTGHFVHYQHEVRDSHSLSHNAVRVIYEDREGTLWIGTYGGGLNRFDQDQEQFTHYQHDDDPHSLINDYVRAIYQDREGTLWIGTDGGLSAFEHDEGRFIHYRASQDPHSLSSNRILSIHKGPSGTLWIGTFGGGINKFNRKAGTFEHYREGDGLPNDVVYGILDDGEFLWLSTNKGLSKFDPRTETFRNYDASNGLQSNEFNAGAYHKSSSGEMFFGGINGFNAFYPGEVGQDNPYVPPVVLTLLQQGGEDVEVGGAIESVKEITFRWPNNFFEFEFAALSYSQPEKNRYAYMLQGFDKDWTNAGTRRFGKYTNLPGGTYTLRVKGSNNDGVWNEQGALLAITIVPPFWETQWFIGTITLVLVGSLIGGYRLRVSNIEARNRELEDQVEERTRALEERAYEIERRRQELEALYRADAELHRHLSLDQVLQALVDIAVDILQADKSSLMVWDEQQERLVVRVARGFSPDTLDRLSFVPGEGTAGYVAVTGKAIIVEDARTDARVAQRATVTEPEGIRSFMQVPIRVGGEIFGVFSADYVQPHAFGDDEQRLFGALAQRAALAIDTAQLYEQTQALAVVKERNRLARDLHDAVTQTLFSASLIGEVLPALWESDPGEGHQLLQELRQLSRGALAEMRTLLLELRPAALVETELGDLLHQLAEATTGREGIPVTVTMQGQGTLPPNVHVALYRMAQEALNNIVKHARASQATVSLCHNPSPEGEHVELRIGDDGCGFDPHAVLPDHLGLSILRERAQAIEATLEIKSRPDHGTQVIVVWKEGQKTAMRDERRKSR
jgi:ligand-binding sensor domain-containing protein/nitrate/nitrite-specific signal transduction histidine kinase